MSNDTRDSEFNDGIQITLSPLLYDKFCSPTI